MIISLLTDFGLSDVYVGVMKGVILKICPDVRIVDLTHGIAPQNLEQTAFVLKSAYTYFPEDTIHMVVIDPGVGSERSALLVQTEKYWFVAPDNGVLKYIFEAHSEARVFRANNQDFWLAEPSATFHGRDIFAPLASHLASGVPIEKMAEPFKAYDRGRIVRPEMRKDEIVGAILYFDHFGNAVTNIQRSLLGDVSVRAVQVKDLTLNGLYRTYADVPPGEPVAYFGSSDTLEIGVNLGNAKGRYGLEVGDGVHISLG